MSTETDPVVRDGPLGVDDYAVDRETVAWIAEAPAEELRDASDQLDYSWNRDGQEDERARAKLNAIDTRLDELARKEQR